MLEYSNIKELLTIKNIPAVTIVAACINADTGVGPSIASGNQVCKPNCADLPTAPINKKKHIMEIKSKSKFKVGFDTVDKRVNHFIIKTVVEDFNEFVLELFKYLKILNKI